MYILLILIAICYCLTIAYLHHKIMKVCVAVDNTTATKQVIGIITDTRPDNLINRDLK